MNFQDLLNENISFQKFTIDGGEYNLSFKKGKKGYTVALDKVKEGKTSGLKVFREMFKRIYEFSIKNPKFPIIILGANEKLSNIYQSMIPKFFPKDKWKVEQHKSPFSKDELGFIIKSKENINEKYGGEYKDYHNRYTYYINPTPNELKEIIRQFPQKYPIRAGITDSPKPKMYAWNALVDTHHDFIRNTKMSFDFGINIEPDFKTVRSDWDGNWKKIKNKQDIINLVRKTFPQATEITLDKNSISLKKHQMRRTHIPTK